MMLGVGVSMLGFILLVLQEKVAQELGLSQEFPSHMFLQQEPSSRAPEVRQEAKECIEPPQSGTDRATRKRKAESHGNVSGTKAGTSAESSTGTFPSTPLHNLLSRLREIEAELICADEADTEFGSGETVAPAVPPAVPLAVPPAVTPPAPPAAAPPVPPAVAQPPAQSPGDSRWHHTSAELQAVLQEGSARYQQCDFAAAAAKFSTALELCSKGFATEDPLKSSPDDISRLSSWIESMLVICYLKLEQPGLALHHSHRSAMVAQYLYILAEGARLDTSDLLQLYWQAMTQEALRREVSFSVLYTPFEKEDKADKIKEANKTFAEKHPHYVQHIFTDPHGIHLLPEKAESHPGQQYLLTLGFRNKEIGKTVEKFVTQKLPVFPGQKITFSPSMEEGAETFWQNTVKKIMAVMAFIGSTKIKDERGPCARAIEQFHHASLLSHLQRGEEQAQVMTQAMAELATAPYLQRVSQEDGKLLQSLMADAVDILAGRTGEHAWTKIQKVTACSKGQESSLLLGVLYHREEEMYRFLEETILLRKREVVTGITIAMLLGLGATGTATGVSAFVTQHQRLSQLQMTIDEDLLRIEKSISSLERSISSLSEVVLQNRRGLDLLLMQQGGLCAALREECCFYADHTGVVRDSMAELRGRLAQRKREREAQQGWFESWFNQSPWLATLVPTLIGPLTMILLTLIFGPCILNKLVSFVRRRLEKVDILFVERMQLP
ncbi:hypothetical protein DUI87_32122 [Hirundo rustica rustica]|uniref:Uncharacterized protein n=1 Tax=Hirundo rustica rustica TaxID=333673 RepID=A0A3M0IXS6_HIRRU|nr:hypothetical protein DUI87_32122 [Hirundo rustica rustica]